MTVHGTAVAILGTDTGVGKTRVTQLLVAGLRQIGQRVWVHKPVACGGFDGRTCDDGRALERLCGDGQVASTICPWQFPEPASPHLAAQAAGAVLDLGQLAAAIRSLQGPHHLVVEGVGGVLVPLTPARETVLDLVVRARLPALIVTRPQLGTLNHTALTVMAVRQRGVPLIGLVINAAQPYEPSLATAGVAAELSALTGLPIILTIPHQEGGSDAGAPVGDGLTLARAVHAWQPPAMHEALWR